MENKINIDKIENLNVGTFGHIDHGKTTLVYKLTGKFTDTHSEELKRGITIKLGYADCIVRKNEKGWNIKDGEPIRYLSFVDAPGHEMLMATMLSGAAMIDVALLVIAANEGIKPQTREHLMALQAKKIKNFLIIQNKIDLVTKEEALKNYKDIKEFVKGTGAENSLIIPVSSQQEVNLDRVLEELCKIKIPERNTNAEPVFVIARSFDINRPGTKIEDLKGGVLGGALREGKLKIGEEIEIKPGVFMKKENQNIYLPLKTKILGIYKGKYRVDEATPGGSIALETGLDTVYSKADNLSGCVAGLSGKLPEVKDKIKIKFNLFKEVLGTQENIKAENIKTAELLLLSINTSITIGTVPRVSKSTDFDDAQKSKRTGKISDIQKNEAELNLRIPVVPFKGENVGIARNINSHWRLIGWGELV